MAQTRSSSALEELEPGLYELLITAGLQDRLSRLDHRLLRRDPLHHAEAADRIALHLGPQIKRALDDVPESATVEAGAPVALALPELLAPPVPRPDLSTIFGGVVVFPQSRVHKIGSDYFGNDKLLRLCQS